MTITIIVLSFFYGSCITQGLKKELLPKLPKSATIGLNTLNGHKPSAYIEAGKFKLSAQC
ncbi:hypothetical protein NBRC116188_18000 [Oceaniserpentilla sp. 4NH20-0058]